MTAGRRSRRRERSTSLRDGAPPPPRPGHVPPARARRRLIVTATGIGGAGLLGISLSAKAGLPPVLIVLAQGGRAVLVNPQELVLQVLNRSRVTEMFTVQDRTPAENAPDGSMDGGFSGRAM